MTKYSKNSGFTLVELIIAMGVMSVSVVLMMQVFATQHRAYVVVDDLSEVQQNGGSLRHFFRNDLQHAGFLVPASAAICVVDRTNGPDMLFVSDADKETIAPLSVLINRTTDGNANGPPVLGTELGIPIGGAGASITVPTLSIDYGGAGDVDLQQGAGVIVTRTNGDASICGKITNNVIATTTSLNLVFPGGSALAAGGTMPILLIPAHVYEIAVSGEDCQGGTANPVPDNTLCRDGIPIAPGVEDFQVAVFSDADKDKMVDPGEWLGVSNANFITGTSNSAAIREVRITTVMLTGSEDPNTEYQQGVPQTAENHTPGALVPDGRRRRKNSTSILLKNIIQR